MPRPLPLPLLFLGLLGCASPASAVEMNSSLERAVIEYRRSRRLDAAPARWIWLPSQRTLPNTFVLFRKEFDLPTTPTAARAVVCADSRYRLGVNGQRAGWGPAPADPRWPEADSLDLAAHLRPGRNVLGAEVLYYGTGDGTYALGKPGFILRLDLEFADGSRQRVITDGEWSCRLDRAHPPGQYRRWYLRALQEEFDARLHPAGWDLPGYTPDGEWVKPLVLNARSDAPAATSGYPEYAWDMTVGRGEDRSGLRSREIPQLREELVPADRLAESGRVIWNRDPEDWFQFRMPGSFSLQKATVVEEPERGIWRVPATGTTSQALFLTYEWKEQGVGWPVVEVEAPEGTIIELIGQEAHDSSKTLWLDSQFFAWSRFVCREGRNVLEPFDFESLRWLQLHIRQAAGPVTVRSVALRRRAFPWPHSPSVECSDPALQRLFRASVNTLVNSCQETCVDGMARERQQYSGDGGHQLTSVRYAFGETRLPKRFLETFGMGQTLDGYFLDCWPAWDRMARLLERQIDATVWGPLLDHGVGFGFDNWNHYLDTGDLNAVRESYPRLLRYAEYLAKLRAEKGDHGLLPVENLGVPSVWMDHDAYKAQRDKQCAFNLYTAAMFRHALAPLATAFGETSRATELATLAADIEQAAVARFWSPEHGLFVNNLPWVSSGEEPRLDDRSLATALLFDQCPGGETSAALSALETPPGNLGISYPCNAGWRYSALLRHGRPKAVLTDFRNRWAAMRSVVENNTLQEYWTVEPDSTSQWSHSAMAPLNCLYTGILGLRPLEPGFARCEIRPCLGDIGTLDVTAHTVRGPIRMKVRPENGTDKVELTVPREIAAELVLPPGAVAGRGLVRFDEEHRRWKITEPVAEFTVETTAPKFRRD